MSGLKENLIILIICSPIFFLAIGIIFRLLDNSASIFLNNGILIESEYVSVDVIKGKIIETKDTELKKSLLKSLFYRKLHDFFIVLLVISLPPVIITCFVIL